MQVRSITQSGSTLTVEFRDLNTSVKQRVLGAFTKKFGRPKFTTGLKEARDYLALQYTARSGITEESLSDFAYQTTTAEGLKSTCATVMETYHLVVILDTELSKDQSNAVALRLQAADDTFWNIQCKARSNRVTLDSGPRDKYTDQAIKNAVAKA